MLNKIFKSLKYGVLCTTTLISPELNTKILYRRNFHKKLDLDNPKTLNEKLLWLKLNKYMNDPLVIQCADKYKVRDYIKKCGCEEILNELYAVYDSPDEIVWDELPEQFALKWNFGAGFNIICDDKSTMNEIEVKKTLKKWGKSKYWLTHSEMQYKYIPKRIICEKYLKSLNSKLPIDYKVYCFNGIPMAILVMAGRDSEISAVFMSTDWEILGITGKYKMPEGSIEKPICLDDMITCSKKLSKPFEFVRIDYYQFEDRLIFGEMTFTPAGGFSTSQIPLDGKDMGEYIKLNF